MDAGRFKQLEIWRACGPSRRVEIASEIIAIALRIREDRLRRRYPTADPSELRWARVREALDLSPGITPP